MRALCLAAMFCLGTLCQSGAAANDPLRETLDALTPEIETLAANSRPADWALLRSCLYYALAGQYLLAREGVATRLESGAVMYNPSSARRHGIDPHVWLESRTHFIDCATLPRWGVVTLVPRSLVAEHPGDVIPGVTRVLVVARYRDRQQRAFLDAHRARFDDALRRLGLPAD
jgi:hypothetical protein